MIFISRLKLGLNARQTIERLIIFLMFLIITSSCDNQVRTYYDNENLKSVYEVNRENKKEGEERIYYETGELKSLANYKGGNWVDSIIKYNKNGTLHSVLKRDDSLFVVRMFKDNKLIKTGNLNGKSKPIGWGSYFSNDELILKENYKYIENEILLNQKLIYSKNNLDSINSEFYFFIKPQIIKKGVYNSFTIKFNFIEHESNLLDKEYFYLLSSPNINETFSNIHEVTLDTIVPFRKNEFKHNIYFKKSGLKNYRAVLERTTLNDHSNTLILHKTRIYIDEFFRVED